MENTLVLLDTQVSVWECSVEKVVAQLSSIMNLVEQQEAIKRGKIGVLSHHPGHVTFLLEVKLMLSMERALEFINKEKEVLSGVVRKLRKCAKEARLIFETSVTKHGLEHTCSKTPETFSTADGAHWCKQLYSAYRADLENKERSLQDLERSTTRLAKVISTWERSPEEAQDTLQNVRYTIKRAQGHTQDK